MKVKVSKISDNENTFSTPLETLDYLPEPPVIGRGLIIGSSSGPGGIRTSTVTEYKETSEEYLVHTRNSIYHIKKIKEES